ncbi:DUF6607 family protein [Aquimarina muelleri]|uniref:DUF6607 family protein n=1 Tax=Aquimarina muelleri TaxID=279356 RepID=UPI003F685B24
MKRFKISSLVLLVFVFTTNAQSKKAEDKNAIKKMCGCYEVTFNFAETFRYSNDSLYKPSTTKIAKALEWAQLIEEDKNKISIQHLLQVGDPSKPHIVKHWRQDWIFQNTDFYMFNGDNSWNYEKKSESEVNGQWTQKVFQVDDSPRYEGSATWVHVDGKSFWENTTDAPLPRREYTQRNDYNITVRRNRHEITKNGWVHDQNNDKVIREEAKEDIILAKEKGYNTYIKVDDSKCKAAADWWKENNEKWALVRNKWEEVYARNFDLKLKAKVDNKALYKYLFSEEYTKKEDVNKVIESFVTQ